MAKGVVSGILKVGAGVGGAIAGTKIGSAIYDQYGAGLSDRYKNSMNNL